MSMTENGVTPRYSTILNAIRREAQKIRTSNDQLRELREHLSKADHPAPAVVLDDVTSTIHVALEHLRSVFREF